MRDGWIETTLGNICKDGLFADGDWVESKDQDPEGDYRLLQLADIGDGAFLDKSDRWMNKEQFQRLGCTKLEVNDVLIARMPDPIGRACLLPEGLPSSATVVDVAIVRTGNEILQRILSLIVNSPDFRNEAFSLLTGTTRQRISRGNLSKISFWLPSLPEQKRIIDLISSVDSYIEALQQQQNFAKQLLQALFQKTFLAEGDFVQLHTVATCIMGQSPEGSTCNKDGIGTPLLTGPTEFQRNNWVGPPRQWTTNETKISISQDILFCVRGATAGRMNLTNYRSVIGRGLAAIRCEDPIDTHFVRFALQIGLNQLLPSAGGTIFPNISQSQLRGFNLPWPNETERRSLAILIKSVEDNTETLDQNLAATKNLRSSLLHDLLSGKHEIPVTYDKVMGAA